MAPSSALPCVLLLMVGFAQAQLPNLRIGLPRDEDSLRQINSQAGYEVRSKDIPFGERFKVQFKYYDLTDEPLLYRNKPPLDVACCYSFNSYWTANAAIHPYWFREFGLDRWCRQDVCLSIWTEDHSHDLMWKVTDVCDPKDCPTPFDVKVEPYKGRYLFYGSRGSRPRVPVYMYFVKCWADGLAQPDLAPSLPGPPLRNSRHWMVKTTQEQWAKNQEANKAAGKPTKPLGMLIRPAATQASLADFNAAEFPPGSSASVKRPAWCGSGSGGGGGSIAQEAGRAAQDSKRPQQG